ncbi:hypothetical protein ACFQ3Z_15970 [Streptomyces nogalater]
MGRLLLSAGKDLIAGMIQGVTSMGRAAIDKVKSIGSGMVSGMKSVLGIPLPPGFFARSAST